MVPRASSDTLSPVRPSSLYRKDRPPIDVGETVDATQAAQWRAPRPARWWTRSGRCREQPALIRFLLAVAGTRRGHSRRDRSGRARPVIGAWLPRPVGVLITGVAISFGSTFWYTVLRRL